MRTIFLKVCLILPITTEDSIQLNTIRYNAYIKRHMYTHVPIYMYVKRYLKIFSKTKTVLRPSLGAENLVLRIYQLYSNGNPRVTFDLLTSRLNLISYIYMYIYICKFALCLSS